MAPIRTKRRGNAAIRSGNWTTRSRIRSRLPTRPQSRSRRPPGKTRSLRTSRDDSRLAGRLEHDGVHRLARRLAGPHHELERLVIALAGVDRGVEQHLALPSGGLDAAGEEQGVAEHDDAILVPQVEMPNRKSTRLNSSHANISY